MCDETIFRILNAHYPSLKTSFNFDRKGLNRALSVKASPCTTQNPHGLYVAKFQTECPYFGNKREVSYYFRQAANDNQPPDHPVSALDVFDKHAVSNQLQRNCIRLGNNMPNLPVGLGGGVGGGGGGDGNTNQDSDRSRTPKTKRARGEDNMSGNSNSAPPIELIRCQWYETKATHL